LDRSQTETSNSAFVGTFACGDLFDQFHNGDLTAEQLLQKQGYQRLVEKNRVWAQSAPVRKYIRAVPVAWITAPGCR